ncbi:hypothetical protein MUK42_06566 [Musa troglodytarum]|uniref:Uncharacterized protein n=1 Tax=Musa troglodytarum TaxID=320322 RepID=A0A9E7EXK6_9LILI|nr:hypothetical protein MUK42_06566 [Musa troglodytarum]
MSSSADFFDFNLPLSESSFLVHADQIFSNGLLLPLYSAAAPKLSVAYDCSSKSLPRGVPSALLLVEPLPRSKPKPHPVRPVHALPSILHQRVGSPSCISFGTARDLRREHCGGVCVF